MDARKDISRVQVLSVSDTGRRRRWTLEEKTRIVEESCLPGISGSEVARRHGISRSQMYEWRYRLGQLLETSCASFLCPVVGRRGGG
ncbi:transposase [Paenirhodobacter sp.]|uniref:transposase n=1 Tax=Paenirhodobacter sp. TaxID=1965326 RepID=UPI003B50E359